MRASIAWISAGSWSIISNLSAKHPRPVDRARSATSCPPLARSTQWVEALDLGPGSGALLDLGCGSGSFLAARARGFGPAVGLDIAMRWLILARKRLDEEGLRSTRLVCGCSEDLPFPASSFHAIVAGDVIEHVNDQAATLAEAHRVLRPGGRLIMATPNRFSLANEPHVGVWGVGFLPRRWMIPYVRLVSKQDFRAIRTLGLGEWKKLLKDSDFAATRILAPPLPAEDLRRFGPIKRLLAGAYNRLISSSIGQGIAKRVGPLFHILAERGERSARESIPATPHRSTPRARRT